MPRANLKRQLQDVLAVIAGRPASSIARRGVKWMRSPHGSSTPGFARAPYHAGLEDADRHRHQDAFLNEEADVVVATVAFGMGIDRSDVRFVVHAGAPQSLEHYQQESGRAGRDGLEAECVLIYSAADFLKWRLMLERSGELTDARRALLRDMERYAAGVGCRHRHLVRYFGDQYSKTDCGSCDYCLGELESVDAAAVIARKILSCVARVGQRFGAAHVANVLCGSENEQVAARGHDRLTTFGLLREAPVAEVRGYIEQLTAEGLLRQTDEPYPVLALTDEGIALLKDASSRPAWRWRGRERPSKDRLPTRSRAETESWQEVDRDLFERLRGVRLQIARDRGVPPTSSSTTRRCASWRGSNRRRCPRFAASTASARGRRSSLATPSSRPSARTWPGDNATIVQEGDTVFDGRSDPQACVSNDRMVRRFGRDRVACARGRTGPPQADAGIRAVHANECTVAGGREARLDRP
jgi:ATP-dependent DNA helicase RecQ